MPGCLYVFPLNLYIPRPYMVGITIIIIVLQMMVKKMESLSHLQLSLLLWSRFVTLGPGFLYWETQRPPCSRMVWLPTRGIHVFLPLASSHLITYPTHFLPSPPSHQGICNENDAFLKMFSLSLHPSSQLYCDLSWPAHTAWTLRVRKDKACGSFSFTIPSSWLT